MMETIDITLSDFREKLKGDPRIQKEYIESIELPQAFASGNKFLKKLILEDIDIDRTDVSSAWFKFSQMIEDIQVNRKNLKIKYDSVGDESDMVKRGKLERGYEKVS